MKIMQQNVAIIVNIDSYSNFCTSQDLYLPKCFITLGHQSVRFSSPCALILQTSLSQVAFPFMRALLVRIWLANKMWQRLAKCTPKIFFFLVQSKTLCRRLQAFRWDLDQRNEPELKNTIPRPGPLIPHWTLTRALLSYVIWMNRILGDFAENCKDSRATNKMEGARISMTLLGEKPQEFLGLLQE